MTGFGEGNGSLTDGRLASRGLTLPNSTSLGLTPRGLTWGIDAAAVRDSMDNLRTLLSNGRDLSHPEGVVWPQPKQPGLFVESRA